MKKVCENGQEFSYLFTLGLQSKEGGYKEKDRYWDIYKTIPLIFIGLHFKGKGKSWLFFQVQKI